ncbi:aldehyde dehydrogenase family protein [Nocardia brevicatena]|uniref:aldehyde dehydrogenase family protein n=1 Tax=Nocardia brevicatena TaxID=37327 RepID=UPI00030CB964|nr:aldehyde dehydrogenase family protein [Nocardia brevicatena]
MSLHPAAHFIAGEWSGAGSGHLVVIDPATEAPIGRVPAGGRDEVYAAVAAAAGALTEWSARPYTERAQILDAFTERLGTERTRIAETITAEVGSPASFSDAVQVGFPLATFGSQSRLLAEVRWEHRVGNSRVLREAAGVVAAITPWNYPLHQIAAKVAPALAVGCTVVLKPSVVAPLNAVILAEAAIAAGLPDGVLNIVFGTGAEVGERLVSHPGVDVVSLTGSTAAGRRVSELAGATVKQVHLELGGKSPNLILDDADLPAAVSNGLLKAFLNAGQTCTALSRMLVPRNRLGEIEEMVVAGVANHRPVDPSTATGPADPVEFADHLRQVPFCLGIGPVVSAAQREQVLGYIEAGTAAGARLLAGGARRPDGFEHGYYVQPTVFSETTPDMAIVREEIFGPVLCLQVYDTVEQAIELANDTPFGLCAAVSSGDEERAMSVARRIRAGQVEINGAPFNPFAPFGGYKQSGYGRELGAWGLEGFLQTKSVQLPVPAAN